ncbi:isochorismatase family protein [Actinacidiphila glaucinigra]|uniref:Nicotinamidase-related amidase n=1 Tax=Actinacidiphila glaucinigra TaxID=235986 RepID=A0A239FTM7_9ACTN|nr:isochorismatase family protein [Actinacidiphila glaucinigra]SNS60496.1 Nicotinamidase-related amidase [Actinacidiphila glaucinigra]
MADGNRHRRLDALLTPRSAAVLTVECQRGVVGPGGALPELAAAVRASGALDATARLVAAAHAAGATVVHAVAERRADGLGSSRNARIFRAAERLPVLQVAGTPAVEVAEEIPVGAGDFVVRRLHGLSPVAGTGLDAVLRNLGVRTVVVTGVSANVAVPNAVFDVVNLGYEAVVPADAIAGVPQSYTADMLRHTLALVATVTTADEVIGSWERSGPGPGDSGQGH